MLSSLGCSDLLLNTSSILQPLTISTSERLGTNLRALAEISETQEGTKSGVSPPSSLSQRAPSRISAVLHSQRASPFVPWSSLPGGHCRGPWGLQGVLLTLLASVVLASAAPAGLYAVSYLYLLTFLCWGHACTQMVVRGHFQSRLSPFTVWYQRWNSACQAWQPGP